MKTKLPTHAQAALLRQIALSPLMLTKTEDGNRYSLANGRTVPEPSARVIIRNGWVTPQRDGLYDEPQTWHARTI